jgi:hypothetical protein
MANGNKCRIREYIGIDGKRYRFPMRESLWLLFQKYKETVEVMSEVAQRYNPPLPSTDDDYCPKSVQLENQTKPANEGRQQ